MDEAKLIEMLLDTPRDSDGCPICGYGGFWFEPLEHPTKRAKRLAKRILAAMADK